MTVIVQHLHLDAGFVHNHLAGDFPDAEEDAAVAALADFPLEFELEVFELARRDQITAGRRHGRGRIDVEYDRAVLHDPLLAGRVLVVGAKTTVALQQYATVWMQVYLVRVCSDVISLLPHEVRAGDNGFPRLAKIVDRIADTL